MGEEVYIKCCGDVEGRFRIWRLSSYIHRNCIKLSKVLWCRFVWGCFVVLGVEQAVQRTSISSRSTTTVCTALPRSLGTIGRVFQCLLPRQVGPGQLIQVWCISWCHFFVVDPLELCNGTLFAFVFSWSSLICKQHLIFGNISTLFYL
jgi:hypothetical protein